MDRSFVTCPACSQVFSEPRELPCRDSLCLACFRSLPADASGGRRCPVCGDLCQLSPEQLRPDAKTSQLVMLFRMAGGASAAADTDQRCSQLNCSALSVSGCGPVSRMSVCDAHLQSELQQLSSKLARLAESHGRLEPTRKRIVSAKWRLEHDLRAVEESLAEMQEMLDNARSSLVGEMSTCQDQVTTCLLNLDRIDDQVARASTVSKDQQMNEILSAKSLINSFVGTDHLAMSDYIGRRVLSARIVIQAELLRLPFLDSDKITEKRHSILNPVSKTATPIFLATERQADHPNVHGAFAFAGKGKKLGNRAAATKNPLGGFHYGQAAPAAQNPYVGVHFGQAAPAAQNPYVGVHFGQAAPAAQNPYVGVHFGQAAPAAQNPFGGLPRPLLRLAVCGNTVGFYSDTSGQVMAAVGRWPLPVECLVVLQANQPDSLLLIDCQNPASRFRCQLTGWDEKPSDLCWVPDDLRLALASAAASVALADLDGSVAHSGRADQLRKLTGLAANADKVFVAGLAADGRRCVACFSAQCLQLQTVIELHNEPSAAVAHGSAVMYGISLCGSGLLFSDPSDGRLRHHCLATGVSSAFCSDESFVTSADAALCADSRGLVLVASNAGQSIQVFLPDGRLLQSFSLQSSVEQPRLGHSFLFQNMRSDSINRLASIACSRDRVFVHFSNGNPSDNPILCCDMCL